MFCSYTFGFDYAFGHETTTLQIFEQSCAKLVDSFVSGMNSTIFMYGQTTSGKTYTMLGDENYEGIISYSLKDIYTKFGKQTGNSKHLAISYLEIYNEQINDLLTPGAVNLRIQ
jgi:centromeric protein E